MLERIYFYRELFRLIKDKRPRNHDQWPQQFFILGHRGARCEAPENTMQSFCRALKHGADGVEFDVCMSSDGIPVIIHDETVDRTTNGSGLVKDLSYQTLKTLDATGSKSGFKPEGVPSLQETLPQLQRGTIVNVELKSRGNYSYEFYCQKVISILKPHQQRLVIIISSFDSDLLYSFKSMDTSFLISCLFSARDPHWPRAIELLRGINPNAIHLPESLADKITRTLAKQANIHLAIWTVNSASRARFWKRCAVDGIFTDRVGHIVDAIRS